LKDNVRKGEYGTPIVVYKQLPNILRRTRKARAAIVLPNPPPPTRCARIPPARYITPKQPTSRSDQKWKAEQEKQRKEQVGGAPQMTTDKPTLLPLGSVQTVEEVVHRPYHLSFIAEVHVVISVRDYQNVRTGHTAPEVFGPLGTTVYVFN
jgi:hypothetical protein